MVSLLEVRPHRDARRLRVQMLLPEVRRDETRGLMRRENNLTPSWSKKFSK
jgi:hypothetical protein